MTVGWLDGFKLGAQVQQLVPSSLPNPSALVSPWQTGELTPALVVAEVAKLPYVPLTRLEALRVPAIAKGRAILHALITNTPLEALDDSGPLDVQPTWLYRSDRGISPFLRMANILDDLIFNEASLLAVKRGTTDQILDATNVPYDSWKVEADGTITVNGKPAPDGQVVYIPGPGPGLLATADRTIRAALDVDRAWQRRVKYPHPPMIAHPKDNGGLTPKEATQWVKALSESLRNPDNAILYVPEEVDLDTAEASVTTDLYVEGRNALRVDIANFLNLPASILDGSVAEASLTYSTQEGRRDELHDYTVRYWTSPIEQALSLDNVVPRGTRVRFNFADTFTTTPSPTGPAEQD